MPRRERVYEDWRPRVQQSQQARLEALTRGHGRRQRRRNRRPAPGLAQLEYSSWQNGWIGTQGTQTWQNFQIAGNFLYQPTYTAANTVQGTLFDNSYVGVSVNNPWWWQDTSGTLHGSYLQPASPDGVYVRQPPRVDVSVEIATELLDGSPDPDALLGGLYHDLELAIKEKIDSLMTTNNVWREWVAQIYDTSWDDQVQRLAATSWPTSNDMTKDVWKGWQQASPQLVGPTITRTPPRKSISELRREREKAKRERMIRHNRARASDLRRNLADTRSERLLRSVLTEVQNEALTERQGFEVTGSEGGRYWIHMGYAGNVYSLDERRRRRSRYCIHPVGVPDRDTMLAQLLMLQHDEPRFLDVANASAV